MPCERAKSESPLAAKPADYAKIVADASRTEANRKLDDSRMPAAVLDFAGYERGEVVADFMAGSGYYTELISRTVGPKGRVYALEPSSFYDAKVWDKLTASHANVASVRTPMMKKSPGMTYMSTTPRASSTAAATIRLPVLPLRARTR